ncbi:MAG: tetratricopeptide repeat protein [Elusimicrobiales bacterium]
MTRRLLLAAALAAPALAYGAADPYRNAAGKLAAALPEGAKVCVLPFHYIGAAEGSRGGAVVAERLTSELVRRGRLTVLERSRVSDVVSALKLSGAGLTGAGNAGKAGRLLGTDFVVTGTLFKKDGGALEFNARAIETAGGGVKAAARASVREDWLETMPEAPAGAAGSKAYSLCKDGMYALDARRFAEAASFFTRSLAEESDGGCGMGIPGMAFMARSMALQGKSGPRDDTPEETGPPTGFTLGEQKAVGRESADDARKLARYGALLKAMPDNAAAYYERGRLYARMKRYREAKKDLDAAVKLAPGKALYLQARGYTLDMLRLYDNALADYSEAIRLDPRYAKAYNGRGVVYTETEQCGKALADFAKAIEYDPAFTLPHLNSAGCLYSQKRYEAALDHCDKAIALDPGFTEAYYWRGLALTGLKRYDAAVKAMDKALELTPGYTPAREGRKEALDRKSGAYDKYAGDSDKGMELFNARETD